MKALSEIGGVLILIVFGVGFGTLMIVSTYFTLGSWFAFLISATGRLLGWNVPLNRDLIIFTSVGLVLIGAAVAAIEYKRRRTLR